MAMPAVEVQAAARADLKIVRFPGSIQLRMVGMGRNPDVSTIKTDSGWTIEVNTGQSLTPLGSPKFFTMPDAGMDSITFDGKGTLWRLEVTALEGNNLAPPVITANGRDVEVSFKAQPLPEMASGSYDLNTPGRVRRNTYVPPLRKRATAPPVGDMAIGTIAIKANEVRMPGAGKVEKLSLRNAPARDVLMTLGRAGGYNVAFYSKKSEEGSKPSGGNPISIDFEDEPIESAVNLVLTLGGLQAKRQGKTLIVGEKLPSFARQLMSRTVRLNQVSPARAVEFLMSQGATFYRTKALEERQTQTDAVEVVGQAGNSTTSGPTTELIGESVSIQTVEADGEAAGALPLRGLTISPDDRLNSITLTGEPNLVTIAEGYLKQIDLRQRQVTVRLQILDVDLNNDKSIDNNFALRTGNTFIVNDNGEMLVNYGDLKPPTTGSQALPSAVGSTGTPLVGAGAFQLPSNQIFYNLPGSATPYRGSPSIYPYPYIDALPVLPGQATSNSLTTAGNANLNYANLNTMISPMGPVTVPPDMNQRYRYARAGFGPYSNPAEPGINSVSSTGTLGYQIPANYRYQQNKFYQFVKASVVSKNTKVLADPTLLVQEGESSSVGVATSYAVNCETTTTQTATTSTLEKEDAGLQVTVSVKRIDDNGFVTLQLDPTLKAPTNPRSINCPNSVTIFDLVVRQLKTGEFRVRDGQTLTLTGVIQDDVRETVTKWPILGDMPLIGQLFRKTSNTRAKRELVIVVTPRIINDDQGGTYGYGYQPSTSAAKKLIYSP